MSTQDLQQQRQHQQKPAAVDLTKEEDQINAAVRRAAGEFVRGVSTCRHVIGEGDFSDVSALRLAVIVAPNCPWAHRVLLTVRILALPVEVNMCYPNRTDSDHPRGEGLWAFTPDRIASGTGASLSETTSETITGKGYSLLVDVYQHYGVSDQKSVPILIDKASSRIINNESSEIIRMLGKYAKQLGSALRVVVGTKEDSPLPDLYPAHLSQAIDEINEKIYQNVANGAYKAGFAANASQQKAYEEAFSKYFGTLAEVDALLAQHNKPFLMGDALTEADIRLWPVVFRHDAIYYTRMKLDGAKITDFKYLWRWACNMWCNVPGVKESSFLASAKQGYFGRTGNCIVPKGPFKPMTYPEAFEHPELVGRLPEYTK